MEKEKSKIKLRKLGILLLLSVFIFLLIYYENMDKSEYKADINNDYRIEEQKYVKHNPERLQESSVGYYNDTEKDEMEFLPVNNFTEQLTGLKTKYILKWTCRGAKPFDLISEGQHVFNGCPVNNCLITSDISHLNKVTDFDAIVFNGLNLRHNPACLPRVRSPRQKYVFLSLESPHNYHNLIKRIYQHYFNWTWTYKFDSDLYFGYVIVKDSGGNVVGPKKEMHWLRPEEMKPINDTLKSKLRFKRKAAVWFASNCKTPSKREQYVKRMTDEMAKYNMTIDVYGQCGPNMCLRRFDYYCKPLIKKFYYFYLSFENSLSEDYVTEKVLIALENDAVPIVFGGANYTRFMPDNAYLDARKLGVKELVSQMAGIINDKEKYYDFFRWRNHYSYHNAVESPETAYYCVLCSKLNEDATSVANNSSFTRWWQDAWNQDRNVTDSVNGLFKTFSQ